MISTEKPTGGSSNPANNRVVVPKNQSTFNADVSITLASITNLFELSSGFSEQQLVYLMNSVVKIITEFLEARFKKKRTEGLLEDERICQQNLGVIWRANAHRLLTIAPETKNILTAYLTHSTTSVKEFGVLRVVELLGILQTAADE